MRIALYGGTFDPIHHGHLVLARDALEQLPVDRVIFLPAAISPHKLSTEPSPAEWRSEMIAAAIAGEERFVLDDREIHRAGPSFTVDTVEEIRRENLGDEIFFLIGGDNVAGLQTWHRIDALRRMVQFVVLQRSSVEGGIYPVLPRRLDISSTEVRERIARGASIRYLVPERVRALIELHHLYCYPGA